MLKNQRVLRWDDEYILHLLKEETILTPDLKLFKDYLMIHNNEPFPTSRFNSNAMRWSCMNGNFDAVKWLHEKNIHPHFTRDAMIYASQGGNVKLMSWIYKNISKELPTRSVYLASSEGNLDALKWLLNKGANSPNLALITASACNQLEIVKWLVEKRKAFISEKAISEAIINYNTDIAKYLKEKLSSKAISSE